MYISFPFHFQVHVGRRLFEHTIIVHICVSFDKETRRHHIPMECLQSASNMYELAPQQQRQIERNHGAKIEVHESTHTHIHTPTHR